MGFTPPELKPIAKQEAFRYWCQKVLPEIYDDSLSYSELLGKVMVKLNEALETINSYSDDIERIDETNKELVDQMRVLTVEISKQIYALGVEVRDKQDKILDLAEIRRGAYLGSTALQKVPDEYRTAIEQDKIDNALSNRIDTIELSKFPNAVIVGEPLIVGSNVSRFSDSNYMVFPFVVDVRGYEFIIDFCFRTGADVNAQQNILDSYFGLALAIKNGKGLMAMSSDGVSWNIGTAVGNINIMPNTVYYARVQWNKTSYTTSISTDGKTYVEDMRINSTAGLYPTAMYIGSSPNIFGSGSAHPFLGGIDMSKAKLTVGGLEVWDGMADPGLASRANVSLSNLDALGRDKFRAENIAYDEGNVADAIDNLNNEKQDKLTFDSVPTVGSTNPVTSGGVAMVLPKMDLLWVNQNTSASFSAQTISLDLESYDFLLFEAVQATGTATNIATINQMIACRIGTTFSIDASQRLPESGNGAFCGRYRSGRITASGIELDTATVYNISGNAVNSYSANVSWAVIPTKIYGIKIAINDLTGG